MNSDRARRQIIRLKKPEGNTVKCTNDVCFWLLEPSALLPLSTTQNRFRRFWWSQSGSNRRHPACKAGALPAELWPRLQLRHRFALASAAAPNLNGGPDKT